MESSRVNLPQVPACDVGSLDQYPPPRTAIQTDNDVHTWQHSESYLHLLIYIRRLGESVVGTELKDLSVDLDESKPVRPILGLLAEIDTWINEIPPQDSPQRYGNLAFRDWGRRLEERCKSLLQTMLPDDLHVAIPFLQPYILTSFGSFIRIDYGTGHELSFVVFLLCLNKIGFLASELEVEKNTVLKVFLKYLHVCWRLQDTYKLEPAGSHGVWGLDDYSFLGYYWGSAQLREKPDAVPSSVLQVPLPDPPKDLYTLSITRVKSIKSGPFHEHSPQLYSIASSVPFWRKVNSGLLKMYEAEVLSKRVVVQHLPLGDPLMPFNKPTHSQTPTTTTQFRHPQSTRPPVVPSGPTNMLPPLRPGVRPSVNTIPGLTSSFTGSSGGARFTVSRAAGRGNIPGAMGLREVSTPLAGMGPPLAPAGESASQTHDRGIDE